MPGRTPSHGAEAGFALVEMLVAMLLLSLVGLTLARFQTFTLSGAGRVALVSAARLEADNIAVDVLAAAHAPTGQHSGTSHNAGRDWHWATAAAASPDDQRLPDMIRIDIAVSATTDGPALARRSLLRPLIWPTGDQPAARPGR